MGIIWGIGLLVLSSFVHADDPASLADLSIEDLMNIPVKTATKTEMKIEEAPGSMTVITRQQILDMNARTLRDILNLFVPGMDVVPTYFRYGDRVNEGIYSRGLLSDFGQQILILFNGQGKFNETTWGSPFPAIEFSLSNIERVEVSRSPIPIHGGAAITIINLITREQFLKNKYDVALHASSGRGTRLGDGPQGKGIAVSGHKAAGAWEVSNSVEFYDDKGQPHRNPSGQGGYTQPEGTLRDGTKGAVGATLLVKSPDEKVTFQSWYKNINRDAYLSAQEASQSNDLYKYEGMVWLNDLKFKINENFETVVGAQISKWTNFYDLNGTPSGGDESNYDAYVEANYDLKFESVKWVSVLNGIKYEREGQYDATGYTWNGSGFDASKSSAGSFAPNDDRDVFSAFSEANWRLSERTTLLTGLRADHYQGFADSVETLVNPRLALSSNLVQWFTFKALYASAARPPSIYERSGWNVVPLRGNENLRSEKVHTFELSGIFRHDGFKGQLTPFMQIFEDKIEYRPNAAGTVFTATNAGESRVTGADLDLWYYFRPRIYTFFNASFFKSEDRAQRRHTFYIADKYMNGGLNYGHGRWNHNLNAYWRGPRHIPQRYVMNRRYASDSHFQMNFSNAYNITPTTRLSLLIENLTDETNNVPLSADGLFVPERGRTFTLQLTVDL